MCRDTMHKEMRIWGGNRISGFQKFDLIITVRGESPEEHKLYVVFTIFIVTR